MASRRIKKKQGKLQLQKIALQKLQILQAELEAEEAGLSAEIKRLKKQIEASRTTLAQLQAINLDLSQKIQEVKESNFKLATIQLAAAQQSGVAEAEKQMTQNWKSTQVKVAEAIGAMKALYEAFDSPYYTSGELIDFYDQIYVKGKIPDLTLEEEERVVEGLQNMGFDVELNEPDPINDREEFIQRALGAIFGS